MRRIFATLALLLTVQVFAGETAVTYIPSSTTDVVTGSVALRRLYLANVTASAVTVTIVDRTTNCNGSACQLWPAVSIAANQVYSADLGGVPGRNGVAWSASAGNAVVGWLTWQ